MPEQQKVAQDFVWDFGAHRSAGITGTGTLIHPLEGQCAYPTP